ncbi:M28 family peptidase [Altererythrobacter sp. H2]|uniref:M28 family metallopeptidase n=1 Tax=Altererythrobacter sp. H2 TaxID=3108391 RepID=UPI002B4BEFAF|nr:M28 family peptidase [Altererythrobacter sp. H2]WRK94804.1 M28 family peptidase [Altererythrobacter sp. H2]
MTRKAWLAGLLALLGSACAPMSGPNSAPRAELDAIEAALGRHIGVLASDEYEGRRPGTQGEALTLRYLAREWQAIGLESGTNDPANPWYAPVDLVMAMPSAGVVSFTSAGRTVDLPEQAVTVFGTQRRDLVKGAPLLFVGNVAKVQPIELVGRVPTLNFAGPQSMDRIEQLAASGAAAVMVLGTRAELAPLIEARSHGAYRLASDDRPLAPIVLVDRDAALAQPGVQPFSGRFRDADREDFRPTALPVTLSLDTRAQLADVRTHNLIARLPGRDPQLGAVLILSHWDHFGVCRPEGEPDRICNGAVDNASGLAMMTELARLLADGPRLDRDVYFLATTAEEWGLLGASAFVAEPPVPLSSVVGAFNLDTGALAPRGKPVAVVMQGLAPFDAEVLRVIAATGRAVAGQDVAAQYLRRQDGWALLQADVPTVLVSGSYADADLLDRFIQTRYHQPGDTADGLELGGAAEDVLLHLALVRHFADRERFTPAAE